LWRDLLGVERQSLADRIAAETGEAPDAAATRVWAATECLKKAAAGSDCPLVFRSSTPDRWVLLAAGTLRVATWVGSVRETEGPLAVAVLSGPVA
jgi:enediyne polyketide synthase